MFGAMVCSVYASLRRPKIGANASRSSISASNTCFPLRAAAIASAAATVVLPTPPLPETTATRAAVREAGIESILERSPRRKAGETLRSARRYDAPCCAPDRLGHPPRGPHLDAARRARGDTLWPRRRRGRDRRHHRPADRE